MKKLLFSLLLLTAPVLTFAVTDMVTDVKASADKEQVQQQKFEARKQEMLKRMSEKQACIEKANSKEEMKKCMCCGHKHKHEHAKKDYDGKDSSSK